MEQIDFRNCIDKCLDCAARCNHCASECLKEKDVATLTDCIQLTMECASVCYTTAQLMSFDSQNSTEAASVCADICIACANECSKHPVAYCRDAAAACKLCAEACIQIRELVGDREE